MARSPDSARELWQSRSFRKMTEVLVLLDDYSLGERLPSFHIVGYAQKRSSRDNGEFKALLMSPYSAAGFVLPA